MRLRVRPGVRIHATGFSRAVKSAPDGAKITPLSQLVHPIAGQSDSRVYRAVKKKRELFPELLPTSPVLLVLPLRHPRPGAGILTRFHFGRRRSVKSAPSNGFLLSLRID